MSLVKQGNSPFLAKFLHLCSIIDGWKAPFGRSGKPIVTRIKFRAVFADQWLNNHARYKVEIVCDYVSFGADSESAIKMMRPCIAEMTFYSKVCRNCILCLYEICLYDETCLYEWNFLLYFYSITRAVGKNSLAAKNSIVNQNRAR